jgi:hypothetical protein
MTAGNETGIMFGPQVGQSALQRPWVQGQLTPPPSPPVPTNRKTIVRETKTARYEPGILFGPQIGQSALQRPWLQRQLAPTPSPPAQTNRKTIEREIKTARNEPEIMFGPQVGQSALQRPWFQRQPAPPPSPPTPTNRSFALTMHDVCNNRTSGRTASTSTSMTSRSDESANGPVRQSQVSPSGTVIVQNYTGEMSPWRHTRARRHNCCTLQVVQPSGVPPHISHCTNSSEFRKVHS